MNATLPVLALATDSTGGMSGSDAETLDIQGDGAGLTGFAPLLEQAHAAVSAEYAVAPLSSMDVESLRQRVQSLPQAGKLLPLLEQLLDKASANVFGARQAVQQIAQKLEQLGSNAELNPETTLVSALEQLLDDMPAPNTPAVADVLARARTDGETSEAKLAGDSTLGRSLTQIMRRQTAVTETGEKLPVNAAQGDSNSNGLDRVLEQAQLRQPEPRQAELASLMATLKRVTVQGRSAASDSPLRAESVTAAVTSQTAQASSPTTSALPTLSVTTPLAQGNWDQALGERIQWMVNRNMQAAQIRLNPAQLGPMEVRIKVQNDQASIQFSSAHGMVREALEAALPRLRELFDASGVELVDVDVSGQSFARGQRRRDDDGAEAGGMRVIDGGSEAETVLETPVGALLENGRLDLFA